MRTKQLFLLFACFLVALPVVYPGGGPEDENKGSERLRVVATTSILGDVVSNIGGNAIELSTLIEAGQDPHGFEPTPSTYALIEKAELIFVNGFELEESFLEDIEAAAKGAVESVSDGIEPIHTEDHDADTHADPHVWFDAANVMIWVDAIEKRLIMADPSNSGGYQARADEYRRRLEELDRWMQEQIASIPMEKRKLITDHHIFGYFAKRYGFEIVGTILPGASTNAEASARSITNLVGVLKNEGVSTIFVGTTAGRSVEQLAETIASELKREILVIKTLTGSLSPAGEPGDTYIGYMEYNTTQIVRGLTGGKAL